MKYIIYSKNEYIYENIIPINENPIGTKDIQVDIISTETFYSKSFSIAPLSGQNQLWYS